uniref:Uncharacterized protein n=1 Tax=Rhizophora mucronata TaxID=61149 RepID=A0A2P2QG59_RHIMU
MLRSLSQLLISGLLPWTRTGRRSTQDRSTRSLTTEALSSGSCMAAPPHLMTTV